MYRIAISDDDLKVLEELNRIVSRCLEREGLERDRDYAIDYYSSASPLRLALGRDKSRYQLVLLDVEFGVDNGLTVAASLREKNAEFSLIYITSHRDFVFESFDTCPLHYLLKPVNEEKLAELVRDNYRRRYRDARLYLKIGGKHTSLAYRDIFAVEATLHKVVLHLKDGTAERNGSLNKLAPELPSWCFCRCHNSFFVNLAHVTELVRYKAQLDNGETVPVSKRFYKSAIEQYIAFLKH